MRRRLALLGLSVIAAGVVLGLVFAGSPTTIANGVRIDGIDVGGMHVNAARALLEGKAARLANTPIVFTAGLRRFAIRPAELGVESDWKAAVADAQRQGGGFAPLRGFKRLDVEVFGADVTPPTRVLGGALEYELDRVARAVDRPARDAAVVRRGVQIVVLPAHTGRALDRAAARELIVRNLAALARDAGPVSLPTRITQPHVRAAALRPAAAQARVALSAPIHLELGPTRWRLTPRQIAPLLDLPSGGATTLRIGGAAADDWLRRLGARVEQPAHDATFAADGPNVSVVPARPGYRLDATRAAAAVLRAVERRRPELRVALLPVVQVAAKLTTARARSLGIVGRVSTYTTIYGGVPNRVHNVQLVAHLVDDKLIAPKEEFSFNKTTGERNAAKGFLVAPVIVNGEVTTGLGGGVCQVSTTVFNAAFEAGVQITARTNHALYISHYPQGRDATVDYPDVDLRFVNDTGHWLLLRTFVGPSSLTVSLYGTPTERKVVSTTGPLVARGAVKIKKTVDPTLKPGDKVIDDPGEPAMTTRVTRDVYTAQGKLLYHDVFNSYYRASPELVRVGPKKKPKKKSANPATTTTTTTTTPTTPQLPG
jgi:vancomycin resistance protein YoaR